VAIRVRIDEAACVERLRRASAGRVALHARALPRIVPAQFVVRPDGCIAADLEYDEDLALALDGAVVAFEADGFDDDMGARWSVHVVGRVTERDGPCIVIEPAFVDGCTSM